MTINGSIPTPPLDLSIVVSSFGRIDESKALVESIDDEFGSISYELIFVTSDPIDSEKNSWLSRQRNVVLLAIGDRRPGEKRQKSLYYYENLGCNAARGNWILCINDDMRVLPGTRAAFIEQSNSDFAALAVPAHIGSQSLGLRVPLMGRLRISGVSLPLLLLDFAFMKKAAFLDLGGYDEGLDWYGKGIDISIRLLLNSMKVGVLEKAGLGHTLAQEGRTPPHPSTDFRYLNKKWNHLRSGNEWSLELFNPPRPWMPRWLAQGIWPSYQRIKVQVSSVIAGTSK